MGLLLESTLIEVCCAILLMGWFLYKDVTKKYSYWRDRGVPYIEPIFPFGCLKDFFLGRLFTGEMHQKFYNMLKNERFFGIYETRKPILIVTDPDLIKRVLTKDFHHFTDRFVFPLDTKVDYISLHLFNMCGQEWKNMRLKLTPTFTSGKIKVMFLLMTKCSEQLRDHVGKYVETDPVIDVKDILARFTMDIIATCAFGLEINSLTNQDNEFYRMGNLVIQTTPLRLARRLMFAVLPFMAKVFTPRFVRPDVSDFLTRIIRETVEYREKNNVNRNDFLDLLIKIRLNKSIIDDEKQTDGNLELNTKKLTGKEGLSIEEITAQSFIFFVAGFETASSTMTFCLYELACNPDIQTKLYKEIKEVLDKYEGKTTHQALQEMVYMDQVINETLRLYASLPTLDRTCSEPYQMPDSDLVLEKGQRIVIPTYAIHHDPDYYPNPNKFDPDRFTDDQIQTRHPYLHLPFGEGPRMCIGMRFGLLQTKLGLTEMVSNFEFKVSPKTQVPVSLHKFSFVTQPEKPILLNVVRRQPK